MIPRMMVRYRWPALEAGQPGDANMTEKPRAIFARRELKRLKLP